VPLAFFAFARFLERQRAQDLAWALLFLWSQAISVWYFGIPLSLLLVVFTLGFLVLRPTGWQGRTLMVALVGSIVLVLALLPVAWPYLEARWELGFERSLEDAAERPADLLSYVDAGPDHRFYRLASSGRYPALFPGFTTFVLAALAFLWLRRQRENAPFPPLARRAKRLTGVGITATLVAIAVFLATGGVRLGIFGIKVRMTTLDEAAILLLLLGVGALGFQGWAWVRSGRDRELSHREWVGLLGLLAVFFILLSLGPVMLLGGQAVGHGIYAVVYHLFPPLHTIRIPLRIGLFSLFLLGLLAAFGLAWLQERLAGSGSRYMLGALPLLLAIEFVSFPLRYAPLRWNDPPPVYRWLQQMPGDFAILEWPTAEDTAESVYLTWSLLHRKRLVHGVSGFYPQFTREVWEALAALPDPEAITRLKSIYPLRYLLVHLDRLGPEELRRWESWAAKTPTGLKLVGRFGAALVFGFPPGLERSRQWERTFSSDYVASHRRARLTVALAREDPEIQQGIEITFNGRPLARLAPSLTPLDVELLLPPPYPRADRNRLRLAETYRLLIPTPADPRYRIRLTGVVSPVDLVVTSASKEYGNQASILVNGVEESPNRRGYNVLVLDQESGSVLVREVFDTFISSQESARLASFTRNLPPRRIVVAAIKDEGVGHLTEDAVLALHSLGGGIDPRGSLFISHLLVGVTGAPPGSAVELAGHKRLEYVVGVDRRDRVMVVRDFRLE
jgi:hypothetical protein